MVVTINSRKRFTGYQNNRYRFLLCCTSLYFSWLSPSWCDQDVCRSRQRCGQRGLTGVQWWMKKFGNECHDGEGSCVMGVGIGREGREGVWRVRSGSGYAMHMPKHPKYHMWPTHQPYPPSPPLQSLSDPDNLYPTTFIACVQYCVTFLYLQYLSWGQ